MKREYFVVASLVFCLGTGVVFAAEVAQTDAPRGILKLPANVSVELISTEHGTLMLTEENGQVKLPFGQYRMESWTLEKKDENGRTWELSGDVNTARMIEVDTEPVELAIQTEPIVCDLKIYASEKAMNFTLGLDGPNGERLRVSGDAPGVKRDQLPRRPLCCTTQIRVLKSHTIFSHNAAATTGSTGRRRLRRKVRFLSMLRWPGRLR